MTDYRDAETGEYVTEEYALANPSTTVAEAESSGTIEEAPAIRGVLNEEITMSDQPNQDLPKTEGAKGRDNAAAKQAENDARKAEREAYREAHPDQTLPEDLQ